MAENELATVPEGVLVPGDIFNVPSKFGDDKVFETMSGGDFLPRVQLCALLSKLTKAGKAKDGDYVVVKGKEDIVRNYGGEITMLVIAWRPKALMFGQDGKGKAYFNPRSEKFKEVEKLGDRKPRAKGALYGPEYLVYLPDIDTICSFHFNNPTFRMRAGEMKALIGRAATLTTVDINSGGNDWKGPVVKTASTPLNLPAPEDEGADVLWDRIRVQVDKFKAPPDEMEEVGDGEPVPEAATGGETRAR